jgi:tetratricopeptide (TPR) repeat protein
MFDGDAEKLKRHSMRAALASVFGKEQLARNEFIKLDELIQASAIDEKKRVIPLIAKICNQRGYARMEDLQKSLYARAATLSKNQDSEFLRDFGTNELNSIAWDIASYTDDPAMLKFAVQLSSLAVKKAPDDSNLWNTNGVVQYRAGLCKEAVVSLEKSIELGSFGGRALGLNEFYLAMAHWQLSEKEKAMECYKKGIVDLETNREPDAEAVRPEVEKLLGIEPSPTPESEPQQETRPDVNDGLNTEEQEKSSTTEPVAATEGSE